MKKFFKKLWSEFMRHFKNLGKFYILEREFRVELETKWVAYQESKSIPLLEDLVDLAKSTNRVGMNNESNDLKTRILDEWDKVTETTISEITNTKGKGGKK